MKRIVFEKREIEISDPSDLEKTVKKTLDERLFVFQLVNSAHTNPNYRSLTIGLIDLIRIFDVLKEKKAVYEFEDADFDRLHEIIKLPVSISDEERARAIVLIQKKFELAKAEIDKK